MKVEFREAPFRNYMYEVLLTHDGEVLDVLHSVSNKNEARDLAQAFDILLPIIGHGLERGTCDGVFARITRQLGRAVESWREKERQKYGSAS